MLGGPRREPGEAGTEQVVWQDGTVVTASPPVGEEARGVVLSAVGAGAVRSRPQTTQGGYLLGAESCSLKKRLES